MNGKGSFFTLAMFMAACGGTQEDLCKGGALDTGSLSGEWKVTASAGGTELGYTYIFDQGLLKKTTSDGGYTEIYDVATAGGTLYLTLQGHGEPLSYCVQRSEDGLVLTQVMSDAVRQEAESHGNGSFGHDVYTLRKVGS